MDLQSFIRETIVQISKGIEDASQELQGSGAIVNPVNVSTNGNDAKIHGLIVPQDRGTMHRTVQTVAFDVGIAASEGAGTKGGIGVVVGAIALGSQGQSDSSTSSTSRIQFTVPIALPQSKHDL